MNAPPEELATSTDGGDKGPGARLLEARLASNFSIEEVSARLHLDRRTLELLEADEFTELPAPTFVRGYLRSYARLLDLPPAPIIEAFDLRGFAPPALIADIASQAETRSTDLWVVVVTIGIAVVLVALATVWFQTQRDDGIELVEARPGLEALPAPPTGEDAPGSSSVRLEPAPEPTASPESTASSAGEPSTGRSVPANPVAEAQTTLTRSADPDNAPSIDPAADNETAEGRTVEQPPGPVGSEPGARSAETISDNASETASAPAVPAADGPEVPAPGTDRSASDQSSAHGPARAAVTGPVDSVSIRFTREAWVEMYDANDKRLYYNLAQPGKQIQVKGVRPIRVLLGYVKGVQVEYNGAPYDFSQYVSKGIARFELRP